MIQNTITKLCLSGLLLLAAHICNAFDSRIFGKITTVENEAYFGYITWNQSKTYWIDYFQCEKSENPYSVYFRKNTGVKFQQNGRSYSIPTTHIFVCRFGNMKKIRLTAPNRIELELKGGRKMELARGSSNDIGSPVSLQNDSLQIKFLWENISEMEFLESPSQSDEPTTFGTVKSNQGIYTGIIEWNNSRQNKAKQFHLYANQREIEAPLQQIRKVERIKNDCSITFTDNRQHDIKNINNNSNQRKSVSIIMPNIGKVDVPWENLETLELTPQVQPKLLSYDDFKTSEPLRAEVITQSGERVEGTIAFDLDEDLDCEVLDGKNDNVTYQIPLQYIRSIEPKNYKYSFITLKNGSALSLGDTQDTNLDNNGVMVFNPKQLPVYIPWNEVKKITFR